MPPKIKTQAFLATLPLFKELAPAELDRLAASTNELHVPRGEILFNKGDPTTGFPNCLKKIKKLFGKLKNSKSKNLFLILLLRN